MDRLVHESWSGSVPEDYGSGHDSARFDLKSALTFTRRRWRTILFTAVGVMILVVLAAAQLDRRYTASALVVVDTRASQLVGFDAAADPVSAGFAIDAEVAIARSPAVIERVVRQLDLWKAPGFAPRPSLTERLLVLVGLSKPASEVLPESWEQFSQKQRLDVIDAVDRALDIQRRPLTSLIDISATAESPDLAAAVANTLADTYLSVQTDEKVRSTQRAVDFLRDRVDQLASEIDALEAELETFVTAKLAELGSAEARSMLLALERNSETRTNLVKTLNDLQGALDEQNFDRAVDLVGGTVADYARRRAALLAQLEAPSLDTAAANRIKDELARIEEEIRSEANNRAALLRTQIADADKSGAQLRARLETELSQQDVPREVGTELFRLQRDAEIQRNLYSSYLTKLRQVEQQSVFDLPDSRIAAPATPPRSASYPPFAAIGLGGLFVSLLAGFGVALLREYYIGGATSAEQLEAVTGVPVIASVPVYRPRPGSDPEPDLAIVTEPLSAFSESIRRMRLGIEAHVREDRYCVFVTSAFPDEGKTTLALALARSIAMTGSRVILVDADFRRPSVRDYIHSEVESGLVAYLRTPTRGGAPAPRVVREDRTGLHLLIGESGADRATDGLVLSDKFGMLVQRLRAEYDVVILDTSPVGLVVDPIIVARHASIGLFVVRFGSTAQAKVRDCIHEIRVAADVPVCAVLNQASDESGNGKRYDGYYR